ncbi:molybdopterin adenylyltransferase [Castellaniella sp.]|uniref:molybdopterin adenylyltransferase n=1 Tax=Castellaniella sp. TaxID=1955812 RepID=UPI00355F646E
MPEATSGQARPGGQTQRLVRKHPDELLVGLVSISDRAFAGQYADQGVPALRAWLQDTIVGPMQVVSCVLPDERAQIADTLRGLVDDTGCDLVLTTGGTGPAPRDVTPDATLDVATRELPGFAEQMRQVSLHFVPTAILSRQVAVLRECPDGHAALILNLPGQPRAIRETLEGVHANAQSAGVSGVFAAVPYCLDLIGGPYIETRPERVQAFRPKSARRQQ